jgi:hypothetical protein
MLIISSGRSAKIGWISCLLLAFALIPQHQDQVKYQAGIEATHRMSFKPVCHHKSTASFVKNLSSVVCFILIKSCTEKKADFTSYQACFAITSRSTVQLFKGNK